MNIWLLTTEYPPFYGGGIGTYAETVAALYLRKGHKLTIFIPDQRQQEGASLVQGIKIIKFPVSGGFELYAEYFAEAVNKKLIEDPLTAPDIIEVQDFMAVGYILIQEKLSGHSLLKNIPIVVHIHMPFYAMQSINNYVKDKLFLKVIEYRELAALKGADGLICPSKYLSRKIRESLPGIKIKIIPLPLPQKIYPNKTLKFKPNHQIDFLFIGRLEYRKGIELFLERASKLWEQGLKFNITVIGADCHFNPTGEYVRDKLRNKYKKQLKNKMLVFYEPMPPEKIKKFLLKTKALIMPALFENMPYVCLEALQAGIPILTTRNGGQAELIRKSGYDSFIFNWHNKGQLENIIIKIINLSKKDLIRIGANGQKSVKNICDPDKNIETRINYFKEIIKKKVTKPRYPFLVSSGNNRRVSRRDYLISIILIIDNDDQPAQILRSLRSIVLSPYDNKEILIIDNNCQQEIIKEALKVIRENNFPGVQIISLENYYNEAEIRNIMLARAQGEWITFIRPGIVVSNDLYTKANIVMKQYKNIFFVCANAVCSVRPENPEYYYNINPEQDLIFLINNINPGVIYYKQTLLTHGQNDLTVDSTYQDYASVVKLIFKGYGGIILAGSHIQSDKDYKFSLNNLNQKYDFLSMLKIPLTKLNNTSKLELLKVLNTKLIEKGQSIL